MFALWLFLACLGKLLATRGRYWFLGFFSGDSGCVLGVLGFLLPPCTFCGLPILLWGRVKVWDGYAGDV